MPLEVPLVQVMIGAEVIAGLVSAEIETTGFFTVGQFRLIFAMGVDPTYDVAYFAGLGAQGLTIKISTSNGGYVELLTGQIDNVLIDFRQRTATLVGRDLAAKLVDSDVSQLFLNLTASEIATNIASGHQLTSDVAATSVPIGQYYEIDHARTALFQHSQFSTEWNLLVSLAKIEGFLVSVNGNVLKFGPAAAGSPSVMTVSSFTDLSFDLAASLPSSVTVKSWSTRNKAVVSAGSGDGASTTLIRPNLSAAQAQVVAENHLTSLNRQEMVMMGRMPGELSLSVGEQILMVGTESNLDQLYTVFSLLRRIDAVSGFTQEIRAYAEAAGSS